MKLLIIDDSKSMRTILRKELEPGGYEICEASNGNEAMNLLDQNGPFDLVTLDVDMPEMDGYRTCERIREDEKTAGTEMPLPIIFVTAFDTAEGRIRGFEVGASNFITKPFEKGEVLKAVRRILVPDYQIKGSRILVVEDSGFSRTILTSCLQECEVNVIEACDGQEGFEDFVEHSEDIDMIITDLEMPKMTGAELCYKIRNELNRKDIPIMVLTAKTEKENVLKLFKLGATDYVVKPFIKEELIARINIHMQAQLYNRILRENVKELEVLSNLKDDFVSFCSRDLHTPINQILSSAQRLMDEEKMTEDQKKHLRSIRSSGELLYQLVSDILDVGHMQTDLDAMELSHVDVWELAWNSIATVSATALEKGIRIEQKNDSTNALIEGDKNALSRIFNNLLSNAIQHTNVNGEITVAFDNIEEGLEICIIDTGDKPMAEKIHFNHGNADGKATDLNWVIPIVKTLVEKQQGKIKFESNAEKGNHVRLLFPVIEEDIVIDL
jgi:CheY-like chemotaxis protein/anti-sigma regulatory factor (Ser/Thr protein kinase)